MDYDLIIIGSGPGGYIAAIKAAQLGKKVALIEKKDIGGTCLNSGCIPTKSLYATAQKINTLKNIANFGLSIGNYKFDYSTAFKRKNDIVSNLQNNILSLLAANKVELIYGNASIVDKNKVAINSIIDTREHKTIITGTFIMIATGSRPSKPLIKGIELDGIMTSDDLINRTVLPKSIAIIGGGVIGIEFASILNSFGVNVFVLEYLNTILPVADKDISKRLIPYLKRKGIQIITKARISEIIKTPVSFKIITEDPTKNIEVENVLLATGRLPNIDKLNLQQVGINHSSKGIIVNEYYMTNIPNIYAIGDVNGIEMLAHTATHQGITAVLNMFSNSLLNIKNAAAVPSCVFSFPEIAQVGMSEESLIKKGILYKKGHFMFGANGKAQTMGETEGFIKILVDKNNGHILGTHIMGTHASDLIHQIIFAIDNKIPYYQLKNSIFAHPTLSECLFEAILSIDNEAYHTRPRI